LILYEMLSGQPLFSHLYDHLTPDGKASLTSWSGLPKSKSAVITEIHTETTTSAAIDLLQWILDKDASARPTTMDEVLDHAFFNASQGNLREHFAVEQIRKLLADRSGGPTRPAQNVMVSYCWADTGFVLSKLAPAIAPIVESLWLDRLGGDEGMGEWTRASMQKGVGDADVVLAVVSPAYAKSKNCGFEMELAAKFGTTIIPLMFGVPFSSWPPKMIGETKMTNQFKHGDDVKLFVDVTDTAQFDVRFNKELLPRLQKGDPVEYIRRILAVRENRDMAGAKVMISYCWADTFFVLELLAPAVARVAGSLWLDRLGGEQGMGEWTRNSMESGVSGADVIIAIVSPGYIKSKNCGFEMELAAKHNKTIIPIMYNVPFAEWPPASIGETKMTSQFKDHKTGDMKLFVDFSKDSDFSTKYETELYPRLLAKNFAKGGGGGIKPTRPGAKPSKVSTPAKSSPPKTAPMRAVTTSVVNPIYDGGADEEEETFGFADDD